MLPTTDLITSFHMSILCWCIQTAALSPRWLHLKSRLARHDEHHAVCIGKCRKTVVSIRIKTRHRQILILQWECVCVWICCNRLHCELKWASLLVHLHIEIIPYETHIPMLAAYVKRIKRRNFCRKVFRSISLIGGYYSHICIASLHQWRARFHIAPTPYNLTDISIFNKCNKNSLF